MDRMALQSSTLPLLPQGFAPAVECTEFACRTANSHPATCRCSCGGDRHGSHGWKPAAERAVTALHARPDYDRSTGFTTAMALPAGFDEEW